MKILKEKKGITLIAVIVTIIILLILALVTANAAINGNIFNNTKKAASRHEMEEDIELINVTVGEYLMTKKMDSEETRTLAEYINDKDWCESAIEDEEDNIIITMAGTGTQYMIDSEGKVKLVHEHDWKETGRLEATCGANGYIDYRCTICRETKREIIPATEEHDFVDNVCTICGYELGWLVPEGGTYESYGAPGACDDGPKVYTGGQKVPYAWNLQDVFKLGNYTYTNRSPGFKVSINTDVTDKNQTEYGEIYSDDINGKFVVSMTGLFSNCTSLTTPPEIPDTIIEMKQAFYGCTALTTVPIVIPNTVTEMEETFRGCTSLQTSPDMSKATSVSNLKGTFYGCTTITTAPDLSKCTNVTNMSSTFYQCSNLTVAPILPASVTNVGSLFYKCKNLKTYPNSSKQDGDFSGYILPSGIQGLANTFYSCSAMTVAPDIPSGVTSLKDTFHYCSNLTTAPIIPNGVTNMDYTFSSCKKLKTFSGSGDADGDFSHYVIPNTVTSMLCTFGRKTGEESGCTAMKIPPILPSGITTLEATFRNAGLTSPPIIPDSAKILKQTFHECKQLTIAPLIPSGVTSLYGTFQDCYNLKTYVGSTDPDGDFSNYVIPNTVTTMAYTFGAGNSAEYGCRIKIAPAIPSSVTSMYYTFQHCLYLETAPTIPSSVTNMTKTFDTCTRLKGDIIINANPESYNSCFGSTTVRATDENIVLRGSSTLLNELAATGGSYVVVGE